MASMAIFNRSRSLIKSLNPQHDFSKLKSISTFSFLSQEAQLAESPPPPQATSPLPPNPASGSPLYSQNWRNPYPPPFGSNSSLIPVSGFNQSNTSRIQALSDTLDVSSLMNTFAEWMTSHQWLDMKQLFEFWTASLDKNGKPNKPDVHLYNHYLRANLMIGASAAELLDLVAQMEDFALMPNTASFNLVLKAMHQSKETEAAEKLLQRMLETGNAHKESLPDDESFNLVLSMLFSENLDTALKILDTALKSGYTLSLDVFNGCVYSCLSKGRPEWLASVIEKCKKMEQNKVQCPSWNLSNYIAEVATQTDNKELALYSMEFLAKWIARGEAARPPVLLSVDEGVVVSALGTAARTYDSKLLDVSWSVLKHSLRQKVPNPESFLAKITALASQGNLPKAFAALRELEIAYETSNSEDLFSPFTSLNPLVMACSKNGFVTLDEVYFQLEKLSEAKPPYKSVAALNCIILGCANIWDVDRAYQTFNAIDATFGLVPNIHSYNALICAFGKLSKRDEAVKVFEHFVGLGVKPNSATYSLLVDAHLIRRDLKAALSVVTDMVNAGYHPSKEMLKKIRRRCIREMDYESDDRVASFAREHQIRMGSENRRNMLFNLDYSTEYV
ncbi:hypothetical protein M9H77_09842 [Catharanthus roseus]|uniref:Uncharacterized protein n=1 Tax=Catharanthus roseus TaxID=4058 RepID=A0ACC0C1Q9_CATRO|nr:hypothetical protein M9H77_09842 [Catharanthus roseus]